MSVAARKLSIDEVLFLGAFGRDVPFQDIYPQSVSLDLETGGLSWVYDDDEEAYLDAGIPPEENASLREEITSAPEQYLHISGLEHGEHHAILQEFLDSDWEDEGDRRWAKKAYFGSIGGWKRTVQDEEIVHAFYEFRDRAIKSRAERFLSENGVEVRWK